MIDFFASMPWYRSHLVPVIKALPDEARGCLYATEPPPSADPVVVASWSDSRALMLSGRPIVLMQHGAGQSYGAAGEWARHPGYPGGDENEHIAMFLCPNDYSAQRWRERYPSTPVHVVGSPWAEQLRDTVAQAQPKLARSSTPTVAFAFHWRAEICPESGSAFDDYAPHLATIASHLRANGVRMLGHAHPRLWDEAAPVYEWSGIEPVASLESVLCNSDVLCLDNSSIGPLAGACGVGVVWLNASTYRREADHGGRFWTWTEGLPVVEDPGETVDTALGGLERRDALRSQSRRLGVLAFGYQQGAATRAASVLLEASDLEAKGRPWWRGKVGV
jgi:hypothetical protein